MYSYKIHVIISKNTNQMSCFLLGQSDTYEGMLMNEAGKKNLDVKERKDMKVPE